MIYIDDISGKMGEGVVGGKKKTRRERKRPREREKESRKISNDVSVRGQLPRLLIKSADGQGGEGDRGA